MSIPIGPLNNHLFKTRMCVSYKLNLPCRYGRRCQFAHGEHELEKWTKWKASSYSLIDQFYTSPTVFHEPPSNWLNEDGF